MGISGTWVGNFLTRRRAEYRIRSGLITKVWEYSAHGWCDDDDPPFHRNLGGPLLISPLSASSPVPHFFFVHVLFRSARYSSACLSLPPSIIFHGCLPQSFAVHSSFSLSVQNVLLCCIRSFSLSGFFSLFRALSFLSFSVSGRLFLFVVSTRIFYREHLLILIGFVFVSH